MSLVLAFATVTQKPQQTHAFTAAIGLQGAVGVYVLGGLLIGGGAALVGYEEYSEEINAHVIRAWENSTALSKAAIDYIIENAAGDTQSITGLGQDFHAWAESTALPILSASYSSLMESDPETYQFNANQSMGATTVFVFSNRTTIPDKNIAFEVNGEIIDGVFQMILRIRNGTPEAVFLIGETNKWTQTIIVPLAVESLNAFKEVMQKGLDVEDTWQATQIVMQAATGITPAMVINDIPQNPGIGIGATERMQELWQTIRDAGLVLPFDEFVPMAQDGTPLTRNAETDTFTGIDGGIYNGDITWQLPNISWRDKSEDVPKAGVWVETPVYTGNPTYDNAITQTPTITDITTGITVANPSVPGGGTPTDPVKPTTPKLPGTQPIVPIALMLGLFDLLRAILMYLSRMFTFLVTLPFVTAIPIENPYFQWFRTAKILGVQPYPLVMTMATFFMSFAAFKSIRRFLP